MTSIKEFQHKILRKYALSGKIRYYDASFFHDMVSKRDFKMISIFEVFAMNRNEQDFLENLYLLKEVFNEEQEQQQEEEEDLLDMQDDEEEEDKIEMELEKAYPCLHELHQVREQLSFEEFQWLKQQVTLESPAKKKVEGIVQVYRMLKDLSDFLHSLRSLFKKMST